MRISLIGWRRSTLGIVTVVACASGLHLSGCVRSSSRDVSADLSRQAAETALKTERAIAARNSRRPLFGSNDQTTKILADTHRRTTPKASPSNEKNPLAELLAKKHDKYPGGDPFIDSEGPEVASSNAIKTGQRAKSQSNIQLTQHQKKQFLSEDGSAIASPIKYPPQRSLKSETNTVHTDTQHDWAKEPATQARSFPPSGKNIVVNESTASGPIRETESAFVKLPSSTVEFEASDLGHWKNFSKDAKRDFAAVAKAENPPTSAHSGGAIAHRDHVKALINQSKNQHSKGELHAAYRSALLASSLVNQYQLTLSENDINPETVAKEISAQIWGASSRKDQESVVAKPDVKEELPIIRPRSVRTKQNDLVFQTSDSFLNWQASNEKSVPVVENEQLFANQQSDLLNEAQVDFEKRLHASSAMFSTSDDVELKTNDSIVQTSNLNEVQIEVEDDQWISSETELLPVQELNAPQIAGVSSKSVTEFPKPMPVQALEVPAVEYKSFENSELVRQPLLAPGNTTNPFSASLETVAEEPSESVTLTAQLPTTTAVESPPQNQLKWGVVAFILAILSTLIGIKLNRTPVGTTKETKDDSENEEQHLKISKAA